MRLENLAGAREVIKNDSKLVLEAGWCTSVMADHRRLRLEEWCQSEASQ